MPEIDTRFLGCPAPSTLDVPTEMSLLLGPWFNKNKLKLVNVIIFIVICFVCTSVGLLTPGENSITTTTTTTTTIIIITIIIISDNE